MLTVDDLHKATRTLARRDPDLARVLWHHYLSTPRRVKQL